MRLINRKCQNVIASLLIVAFTASGCSTVRVEQYERQALGEQRYRMRHSHLEIGATPVSNEVELSRYFGANLFGANLIEVGILPIFVRVKNVDTANSYIVGTNDISLSTSSSLGVATSDAKVDSNVNAPAVAATALTVPALLFTPAAALMIGALLATGKMLSDASVVQHNMTNKQFLTTTLAPSREGDGFLYFKLPEVTANLSTWHLRVNVTNPANGEKMVVELPMDWDQDKGGRK